MENHEIIKRNRPLSGSIDKLQQQKLRHLSSVQTKTQITIPEVSELDNHQSDAVLTLDECNHDEYQIKELKQLIEKLQLVSDK